MGSERSNRRFYRYILLPYCCRCRCCCCCSSYAPLRRLLTIFVFCTGIFTSIINSSSIRLRKFVFLVCWFSILKVGLTAGHTIRSSLTLLAGLVSGHWLDTASERGQTRSGSRGWGMVVRSRRTGTRLIIDNEHIRPFSVSRLNRTTPTYTSTALAGSLPSMRQSSER